MVNGVGMAAARNTLAAGSWLANTQMKVCAEFSECRTECYVSETRQKILMKALRQYVFAGSALKNTGTVLDGT